ncbi:MAG: hypothetical protein GQE15_03285 [Archangiaceae bacterium]|nr:hypothetical protein [Archangiaceae bacterium]
MASPLILFRVGQGTAAAGIVLGVGLMLYAGSRGSNGAIPALVAVFVAFVLGACGALMGIVGMVNDSTMKRQGLIALGLGITAPVLAIASMLALVPGSAFRI